MITVGTLGKALGSYGAFVCCSREIADYLVNRARTLIYSTALPAAVDRGGVEGAGPDGCVELVGRLHANARVLREALGVEVERHADRAVGGG